MANPSNNVCDALHAGLMANTIYSVQMSELCRNIKITLDSYESIQRLTFGAPEKVLLRRKSDCFWFVKQFFFSFSSISSIMKLDLCSSHSKLAEES